MVKLFVRHRVDNFENWHRAYQSLEPLRSRYGVVRDEVYASVDDDTDVTVSHEFNTLQEAQAILASEEIAAAVAKAGVVGPPTAWIVSARE
jgi:hypothetical protein